MIDLNTLQQQMMQPETGLDRAMADPIFQIGLAMMSSPNIGQALQQGLKTSQALKISKLDNQLRLAELQARMMPETAKPTALMRHMEIASDPNNPLAQMMQKYLFKPTGTSVRVSMPGPVVQGMEKLPGYLGPGPDEGTFYRMGASGQPEIGYLPGAQEPSAEERAAAQGVDEFGRLLDQMDEDEKMFTEPSAHIGQVAADVASDAGPIVGAAVNALTPERNQAYNVGANRVAGVVTKDISGQAATDVERRNILRQVTVKPGDADETIQRKKALRRGMQSTMAKKGRPYITVDEFNKIQADVDRVQSGTAPQVNQPPASLPNSTGDAWLDSALGIK